MDSVISKRTLRHGSFFREPALIALQTMRAHKLRSFLMLLGIILSVSTLILVVALISGMNGYFASRVANLGSNVFLIHKFPIISDSKELLKATRRNRDITWEDYEALRDNLKLPQGVGVEVRRTAKVRAERQNLEDVDLRGVTANIGDMDVEEVATGRYITDSDNRASRHGLHDRRRRGREAVRQYRSAGQDHRRSMGRSSRWSASPKKSATPSASRRTTSSTSRSRPG